MADILIRNVPNKTLQIAKRLAKKQHHSLQEELLGLIVNALEIREGAWSDRADLIRDRLKRSGKSFTGSESLQRDDRSR